MHEPRPTIRGMRASALDRQLVTVNQAGGRFALGPRKSQSDDRGAVRAENRDLLDVPQKEQGTVIPPAEPFDERGRVESRLPQRQTQAVTAGSGA